MDGNRKDVSVRRRKAKPPVNRPKREVSKLRTETKGRVRGQMKPKVNRPDPTLTCRRIITEIKGLGWVSMPILDEEEWDLAEDN